MKIFMAFEYLFEFFMCILFPLKTHESMTKNTIRIEVLARLQIFCLALPAFFCRPRGFPICMRFYCGRIRTMSSTGNPLPGHRRRHVYRYASKPQPSPIEMYSE